MSEFTLKRIVLQAFFYVIIKFLHFFKYFVCMFEEDNTFFKV